MRIQKIYITEAKEDGVDRHSVDGEEQTRNKIRAKRRGDDGHQVIIDLRDVGIQHVHTPVKDVEGTDGHGSDNHQTTDEKEKIRHLVQDDDTDGVAEQQRESFRCGRAEIAAAQCAHDVGVPIDESHKFLQSPEAALAETHETAAAAVVDVLPHLPVDVLEDHPDGPNDGDD